MVSQMEPNIGFDDDDLPPGQLPIVTKSVEQFNFFVGFIIHSKEKTGYSTMAIVTGKAGSGKTVAIQTFLKGLVPRTHTGLPTCVAIKVKPGSTPRAMLEDLLLCFGERPRTRLNSYKIADEAANAIVNNDLKGLFVDEADQLSAECFEFLRYIFNKTGCPIILVGESRIKQVVRPYEKFKSRVGPHIDFLPPTEEEVLQTILPALTLPYWSFDPTSATDLKMGKELWASVRPSFRSLRVVLQYASLYADMLGGKPITTKIIKESRQTIAFLKRQKEEDETGEQETPPEDVPGPHEEESEQRHKPKNEGDEAS